MSSKKEQHPAKLQLSGVASVAYIFIQKPNLYHIYYKKLTYLYGFADNLAGY
jgi:hypothetical protein